MFFFFKKKFQRFQSCDFKTYRLESGAKRLYFECHAAICDQKISCCIIFSKNITFFDHYSRVIIKDSRITTSNGNNVTYASTLYHCVSPLAGTMPTIYEIYVQGTGRVGIIIFLLYFYFSLFDIVDYTFSFARQDFF